MEEIRKISISDSEYPESLKKISEPPKEIYLRGEMPIGKCFAVVGTRRWSAYGRQAALEITGRLSRAGLVIVSGLASGIDTFSHKAALESDGKTIAVLGTGLDDQSIYPKENLGLAKEIIQKGGCMISELSPGSAGFKSNFPARNRIISGLSLGVLVVEAKEKSGALITARWAKEQKKRVFALPGSIFSQNSRGPNSLIKNGAKLVQSADDILADLGENNKTFSFDLPVNSMIGGLNEEEKKIINVLRQGPIHLEKIIELSGLSAQKVCSILAVMEIEERIRNLGGGIYGSKNQ